MYVQGLAYKGVANFDGTLMRKRVKTKTKKYLGEILK